MATHNETASSRIRLLYCHLEFETISTTSSSLALHPSSCKGAFAMEPFVTFLTPSMALQGDIRIMQTVKYECCAQYPCLGCRRCVGLFRHLRNLRHLHLSQSTLEIQRCCT